MEEGGEKQEGIYRTFPLHHFPVLRKTFLFSLYLIGIGINLESKLHPCGNQDFLHMPTLDACPFILLQLKPAKLC